MMASGNNVYDNYLKILIVEDDFYCRRLLQRYLSPYGDCDIALNGKEAVDAYERSLHDEFGYDLVCLDLVMPEMDGQETLKKIREIEEKHGIYADDCVKVIITSATKDKRNILDAFCTGAEGYVAKPITRDKLLSTVKELGVLD